MSSSAFFENAQHAPAPAPAPCHRSDPDAMLFMFLSFCLTLTVMVGCIIFMCCQLHPDVDRDFETGEDRRRRRHQAAYTAEDWFSAADEAEGQYHYDEYGMLPDGQYVEDDDGYYEQPYAPVGDYAGYTEETHTPQDRDGHEEGEEEAYASEQEGQSESSTWSESVEQWQSDDVPENPWDLAEEESSEDVGFNDQDMSTVKWIIVGDSEAQRQADRVKSEIFLSRLFPGIEFHCVG